MSRKDNAAKFVIEFVSERLPILRDGACFEPVEFADCLIRSGLKGLNRVFPDEEIDGMQQFVKLCDAFLARVRKTKPLSMSIQPFLTEWLTGDGFVSEDVTEDVTERVIERLVSDVLDVFVAESVEFVCDLAKKCAHEASSDECSQSSSSSSSSDDLSDDLSDEDEEDEEDEEDDEDDEDDENDDNEDDASKRQRKE